jgi:purine-binding chemotaxis protein CheW
VGNQAGTVDATGVDKNLTFRLADEVYGIGILKVQEIIGMMPVTRVPKMASYVRGVINLRGRIIPVIDLRQRFGLGVTEDTDVTCIIVVQVEGAERSVTVGVIVDEVQEVVDIPSDQIEPVPDLETAVDDSFVRGVGKLGQHVVLLLDIDQVLTASEFDAIERAAVPTTENAGGEGDA